MKKFDLKSFKIEPHHILVTHTSEPDYEMSRKILLELSYDQYVVVEGWHCSCYDFNDAKFDAIEYTRDEIRKLSKSEYNINRTFWKQVRLHLNVNIENNTI